MRKRQPKKQSYATGTPRKVVEAFSELEKRIIREQAALRARLSILAPEREKAKAVNHN